MDPANPSERGLCPSEGMLPLRGIPRGVSCGGVCNGVRGAAEAVMVRPPLPTMTIQWGTLHGGRLTPANVQANL